uniref:Capsid protein n=1 Tax=Genomoviridae sp. TaxID=2202565 RepID=A0A858NE34_9VIRU|nr:MAG: capsid protein [Genomoviridae sp.]QJB18589.1 MAG: capsid protein [Genomoviridae sp.]
MYRKKYKRRKYSRKRKYNKGRVSKTIWKASKKAAKAQVYRMSETKRLHFVNNLQGIASGTNYNITAFSPFQPFTNGLLQGNVIGNDIDVRYFEIRYMLFHNAAINFLAEPVNMRVTLLKTPTVWTLGAPNLPYIPDANIPAIFIGNPNGRLNFKFDSNLVKVISQKTINMRGETGSTNVGITYRHGKIKLRGLKGKKTFMAGTGLNLQNSFGQVRQGQYYVVIQLFTGSNSAGNNDIKLQYDWSMYYKDM